MSATIDRAAFRHVLVCLVIGLCAVSLAMHFSVESLGVVDAIHFHGEHGDGLHGAHEDDHFIIAASGNNHTESAAQTISAVCTTSRSIFLVPFPPPPKSN
jgi:hypothetical protein